MHLTDLYGVYKNVFLPIVPSTPNSVVDPIYRLTNAGKARIIINTQELLNEVCDGKRFTKTVSGPLGEVQNNIHEGLFTAHLTEHN